MSGKLQSDAIQSAKVFFPFADEIYNASLAPVSSGQTSMEGYLEKVTQVMSSLSHHILDVRRQFVDDSGVSKVNGHDHGI